ncbi:MAG: hypothetical protein HY736_25880 [Verrucomicrobia bacterium]|nr:hypothetical protein [Verrucomicrobiota bacterium]
MSCSPAWAKNRLMAVNASPAGILKERFAGRAGSGVLTEVAAARSEGLGTTPGRRIESTTNVTIAAKQAR